MVVVAIVSVVAFGVYYYGFRESGSEDVTEERTRAKKALDQTLGNVNTDRATRLVTEFKADLDKASSKERINSILDQIGKAYEAEQKRIKLLDNLEKVYKGPFENLLDFRSSMSSQIKNADSLSELRDLEDRLYTRATEAWRSNHISSIENIAGDIIIRVKKNSLVSEAHSTKVSARNYVNSHEWEILRNVKFQAPNTFLVPVTADFGQAPGVEVGTNVDVVHYISENDKTVRRVQNTVVRTVLYPRDDLATINWNVSTNESGSHNESESNSYDNSLQILERIREVTPRESKTWENENAFEFSFTEATENSWSDENSQRHSFSTNVWEEIKASIAGSEEAKAMWNEWASQVIETARDDASLADYDLEVLYMVEVVNGDVAADLANIERSEDRREDTFIVQRK